MPNPRKHQDAAARQRAYRERKKAEAAAPAAAPTGVAASPDTTDSKPSPVMQAVLATNPNAVTLAAIRDDEDALNADRLRAAVELGKLEAVEHRPGDTRADELRELRRTIEALPPGDRLAWLKGEKDAHAAAGAYTNEEE